MPIALKLGRVSNLPTVWTNTLAAVMISGGAQSFHVLSLLLFAMSLAYVGGMYLNDAFDRHIDIVERPERPIPAGLVRSTDVFIAGSGMLALAICLTAVAAYPAGQTVPALFASTGLAACILLYNAWHKGNPLSPVIMGLCRVMVYLSCALAVTDEIPAILFIGCAITLSYLIGLTFTAKQENPGHVKNLWPLLFLATPVMFGIHYAGMIAVNWVLVTLISGWTLYCLSLVLRARVGDIPRAVVRLIAGISLVDGLLIVTAAVALQQSGMVALMGVVLCLACFAATLVMQRIVSGT